MRIGFFYQVGGPLASRGSQGNSKFYAVAIVKMTKKIAADAGMKGNGRGDRI
jgi:hypothetical protein